LEWDYVSAVLTAALFNCSFNCSIYLLICHSLPSSHSTFCLKGRLATTFRAPLPASVMHPSFAVTNHALVGKQSLARAAVFPQSQLSSNASKMKCFISHTCCHLDIGVSVFTALNSPSFIAFAVFCILISLLKSYFILHLLLSAFVHALWEALYKFTSTD